MKLCRFDNNRLGVVQNGSIRDVTDALDVLPAYRHPFPGYDVLIANLDRVRARIDSIVDRATEWPLDGRRLLSPVANPGKIVAALSNYRAAADAPAAPSAAAAPSEGNKGLVLKAVSSLAGAGDGIALRGFGRQTDHEVELAVVIGQEASEVDARDAFRYIAGYSIGLDITMRGKEERSFRKSPDTYTVLGPWLVTADEIPDPETLDLDLSVNGAARQTGNTRSMITGIADLVALASSFYTLHPGDIVLTGTPEGAGSLEAGDDIVASIERIGSMGVAVRTFRAQSESMSRAGQSSWIRGERL